MLGLLIIAHAPLASALKSVAEHTFPERAQRLEVLDVLPDMEQEDVQAKALALLRTLQTKCTETVILTDVFGATPCNAAQRLAQVIHEEGLPLKIIAGVNVPMLWRVLCYEDDAVEVMVSRAIAGATQGVISVGVPKPQNQANKGALHDQNHPYHQQ